VICSDQPSRLFPILGRRFGAPELWIRGSRTLVPRPGNPLQLIQIKAAIAARRTPRLLEPPPQSPCLPPLPSYHPIAGPLQITKQGEAASLSGASLSMRATARRVLMKVKRGFKEVKVMLSPPPPRRHHHHHQQQHTHSPNRHSDESESLANIHQHAQAGE